MDVAVYMQHDQESRAILKNYVRYLLGEPRERSYFDLSDFLEWYGRKYLIQPVHHLLSGYLPLDIKTFVEFGPGSGWLIGSFNQQEFDCYAYDKRSILWKHPDGVIFATKDLEQLPTGLKLPKTTLIIANQFIHCIDWPEQLIREFNKHYWLVIEPMQGIPPFSNWHEQMRIFGATPQDRETTAEIFMKGGMEIVREEFIRGQWFSLWQPMS